MKFKYSEYGDTAKIYRPTLPVVFKHKSNFIKTTAIIDSGADFTILPIEMAGYLDIKIDVSTKTKFNGAGSNSFTVYPSPVSIEHIVSQGGFRPLKWKAKVFFAESQPAILLGHKGFLERFEVRLNGPKREVEIIV